MCKGSQFRLPPEGSGKPPAPEWQDESCLPERFIRQQDGEGMGVWTTPETETNQRPLWQSRGHDGDLNKGLGSGVRRKGCVEERLGGSISVGGLGA